MEREWFELMLKGQLALGRPDHVEIVFGRKITAATPGPVPHPDRHKRCASPYPRHYKRSKVKQYFKHGRALRTETVINDPGGFCVGRTLNASDWLALTRVGHETNERLISAQLAATLQRVVSPSIGDSPPAPACASANPG